MKVDIVVRSDADAKGGGDSEQVAQYIAYLGDRVDFLVCPFSPRWKPREGAVVHIVNIDRPFDFLLAARRARRNPTVVSPIHHSLARTRRMRRAESGRGTRSILDRVLPEALREWLASTVRGLRASRRVVDYLAVVGAATQTLWWTGNVWRRVGEALTKARVVALLAPGEGVDLEIDADWSPENAVVIPNGKPDTEGGRPWMERDVPVAVVGRIEPRKRSLEIARAADSLNVRVTFAGAVVNPSSSYAKEFERLAAVSPYVDYLGRLSHEEVLDLLGRARVLLNASWVEVQSLVDLEAAFCGARVLSAPNGNSSDWLKSHVTLTSSFDIRRLVVDANRVAAYRAGPGLPTYEWDWARVAEAVYAAYRSAADVALERS